VSVGLVGTWRDEEDTLAGLTLKQQAIGGRVEAGLSVPLLGPLLHLELMPYGGVANGRLEVTSLFGSDSVHDLVTEYGIHLDAIARVSLVQGGLGVGWAHSQAHYDVGLGNNLSSRVDIEQEGFLWRALLGFVF
jgi:hypothetical protein